MRLLTRSGHSTDPDPVRAVAELAERIRLDRASGVVVFCAPTYDLAELGRALAREFAGIPVVGATSAGQIGPDGLVRGGVTGLCLASTALVVRTHLIPSLRGDLDREARAVGDRVRRERRPDWRAFGLLLVDGLSLAEERLSAGLYASIGEVPFVGGSAADDLRFEATHVYVDGAFRSDAAVLAVFETLLPFRTFQAKHLVPTDLRCVVTSASTATRTVHEIDGRPAAEAYAARIGVPEADLGPAVFAAHPLMLRVGAEWYVRSISRCTADGGLVLFCAIEEGMVLSVGRPLDLVSNLDRELSAVEDRLVDPAVILGCDCVLRRLELERAGQLDAAGRVFARHRVFGFSTYGEQHNSVHVNQTFTGIAIGASP